MRARAGAVVMAAVTAIVFAAVVQAHHGTDVHSDNMRLVGHFDDKGTFRAGTDLAFWGDKLIAGKLDQGTGPMATPPGGFRVMDISQPGAPKEIGQWDCWGDQSDVSVWKDLVIVSVDKPTTVDCSAQSGSWEGIRVVSIADPANPKLLGSVATDCGSHTNTTYADPKNDRLLVYVLSYPLAGRYNPAGAMPGCNAGTHRKFSVVEVPLGDPGKPKVLHTVPLETNIGCHDVTLFLERQLAAAACLTESQMWSLEDPAKPKIIGRIPNPRGMQLSHSTTFSNDGKTLVIGDEYGGAAASPGCLTGDQRDVSGGLFFFDVTDPAAAKQVATFKLPQRRISEFCTAHLFNVVPLRSDEDILVSSWYTGATSVIDFTAVREGKAPEQLAYYIPRDPVSPDEQPTEAAAWASYWYRGHVWSSNFDQDVNSLKPRSRGLDVFAVDLPVLKKAVDLRRLNPQVQEPIPPPEKAADSPGAAPKPGKARSKSTKSKRGTKSKKACRKKKGKARRDRGKRGRGRCARR